MLNRAATAAFAILVLFAMFGGMVFGRWIDYWSGSLQLQQFLEACPPNELRFEQFDTGGLGYHETIIVNFTTGKMSVNMPLDSDGGWTLFWVKDPISVFSTVHFQLFFLPPPYNSQQIERIQQILSTLQPPLSPGSESYRHQIHLAFWKKKELRLYHYSKGERQPDLQKLSTALHIGAFESI